MDPSFNPWLGMMPQDPRQQLLAQQAQGLDPMTMLALEGQPPPEDLSQMTLPLKSASNLKETGTETRTKTSGKGMVPESQYNELIQRLNDRQLKSIQDQGMNIEDLKKRLAGVDQKDMPINLQPIAALVDSWTGSNLSPYATPQETVQSRQAMKDKLQAQLLGAQQGLSENEISMLRSQLNNQFQTDNLEYQKQKNREQQALEGRKLDIMEKSLGAKAGMQFTPAQKKIDEEFGKTYDEDVTKGGLGRAELQLKGLEDLQKGLTDGTLGEISGPKIGSQPMALRKITNPKSVEAQQQIEKAVQSTMRETLGAQFTEKEGKQILERTFDPMLTPDENARRLGTVVEGLKAAKDAKTRAIQYYEGNGTLKGYSGYKDAGGEFLRSVGDFKNPGSGGKDNAAEIEQIKAELKARGK